MIRSVKSHDFSSLVSRSGYPLHSISHTQTLTKPCPFVHRIFFVYKTYYRQDVPVLRQNTSSPTVYVERPLSVLDTATPQQHTPNTTAEAVGRKKTQPAPGTAESQQIPLVTRKEFGKHNNMKRSQCVSRDRPILNMQAAWLAMRDTSVAPREGQWPVTPLNATRVDFSMFPSIFLPYLTLSW